MYGFFSENKPQPNSENFFSELASLLFWSWPLLPSLLKPIKLTSSTLVKLASFASLIGSATGYPSYEDPYPEFAEYRIHNETNNVIPAYSLYVGFPSKIHETVDYSVNLTLYNKCRDLFANLTEQVLSLHFPNTTIEWVQSNGTAYQQFYGFYDYALEATIDVYSSFKDVDWPWGWQNTFPPLKAIPEYFKDALVQEGCENIYFENPTITPSQWVTYINLFIAGCLLALVPIMIKEKCRNNTQKNDEESDIELGEIDESARDRWWSNNSILEQLVASHIDENNFSSEVTLLTGMSKLLGSSSKFIEKLESAKEQMSPSKRIIMLLNLKEAHWVYVHIKCDSNGKFNILYADPLADSLPSGLRSYLLDVFPNAKIESPTVTYETNPDKTGPWVVALAYYLLSGKPSLTDLNEFSITQFRRKIEKKSLFTIEDDGEYDNHTLHELILYYVGKQPDVLVLTKMSNTWRNGETLQENLRSAIENLSDARRIVIPLNLGDVHWVYVQINYDPSSKHTSITYVDSLGNPIDEDLKNIFQEVFPGAIIISSNIKYQKNTKDCGVWVVAFANSFINDRKPPKADFDITNFRQTHEEIMARLKPLRQMKTLQPSLVFTQDEKNQVADETEFPLSFLEKLTEPKGGDEKYKAWCFINQFYERIIHYSKRTELIYFLLKQNLIPKDQLKRFTQYQSDVFAYAKEFPDAFEQITIPGTTLNKFFKLQAKSDFIFFSSNYIAQANQHLKKMQRGAYELVTAPN